MGEPWYRLWADVAAKTDLAGNDKVVLAIIGNHIRDKGYCWVGVKTLAREAGTSRRTALRGIERLEAARLLQVERRGKGKANHYRLTGDKMAPATKCYRGQTDTSAGDKVSPEAAPKCHSNKKESLKKKQRRRLAAAPEPRVKTFIDWFCEAYSQAHGRAYVVGGAKDGGLVKTLLARLGGNGQDPLALLQGASRRMLADEWGGPRASIGLLSSQINAWLGTGGHRGRRAGQFRPADPKVGEYQPDEDFSGGEAAR